MLFFAIAIAIICYIVFSPDRCWDVHPTRVLQGVCWGSLLLVVLIVAAL